VPWHSPAHLSLHLVGPLVLVVYQDLEH